MEPEEEKPVRIRALRFVLMMILMMMIILRFVLMMILMMIVVMMMLIPRFVLNECSDGLVVGTDGPEGGRVQMWSMLNQVQAPHRLFHQGGSPARQRVVPEWRYCEEFSGGGGRVVGLATPR